MYFCVYDLKALNIITHHNKPNWTIIKIYTFKLNKQNTIKSKYGIKKWNITMSKFVPLDYFQNIIKCIMSQLVINT